MQFYLVNSRIIFRELTNYHTGGNQEIPIKGSPKLLEKLENPHDVLSFIALFHSRNIISEV